MRVEKFVSAILIVGLLGACTEKESEESKKIAAQQRQRLEQLKQGEAVMPTPPQARPKLGGGYQNLKWGISRAEVKKTYKGKLKEDRADSIIFTVDKDKEVTAYFIDDKLFRVRYEPMIQDSDESRALLLTAMIDKFNKPTDEFDGHTTFLDTKIPTHTYLWQDDEMSIEMTHKLFQNVTDAVANSTVMNYYQNAMQKMFEDRLNAKEKAEETKKRNETIKSMKNNL